jgi:sulfane dehydrogenase subunit SoxC
LECAGNQRTMFELVQGRPAKGNQWKTGGVSNGEWTGVALRDVLQVTGVQPDATAVLLVGLDEKSPEAGFRRAMPLAQALHPDTLLAYALNGEVLPRDHGFPLRAVVPGWVGSSWVKWLGHIIVTKEPIWSRNNTTQYVLIGENYLPEGEAHGQVITLQTIKSALALPWPAQLIPGAQRIYGYAHSPHGKIAHVEWSADNGQHWQPAELLEPQIQYSWARFVFTWPAMLGDHTLMVRATDVAGNTQPDQVPYNTEGYLFNQPLPHPVEVRSHLPLAVAPQPLPLSPPPRFARQPEPEFYWQI